MPNQWSLRPAGRQLELGDFPVSLALHPSGRWLAALHAGYGTHEIIVVELEPKRQKIACRVPIDPTRHYFDSKFEIKTTVHKQAEWREKLAAAR